MFGPISKAIAGGLAGAVAGVGTTLVVVPGTVEMPWYGYVLVGVLNAALGFAAVYFAPKNTPA